MKTLQALPRESKANLAKLRSEERIPAVVYGMGIESTPLSVDRRDFIKLFKETGETEVIELELDGKKHPVLVHDMDVNAVTHSVLHIDFYRVDMNKAVEVTVPIVFVGEAPAEKMGLGVLIKALQEVEIEVLPTDIPHEISVDVSSLDTLEANIYARDLKLPKSATLVTEEDTLVATCAEAREESADSDGTIDFANIAVEKKGKKEEAAE